VSEIKHLPETIYFTKLKSCNAASYRGQQ